MCYVDLKPALATERLVLRAPAAADARLIADMANDWDVARMLSTMPYPYALSDAEAWLAHLATNDPRTDMVFALEHRQLGLIGMLGLEEKDPGRTELGYWLGRAFWGRGYATEAVRAALAWAHAAWRRNVVWAGHFAENDASGQVLCKAGFLYTGEVVRTPCRARGGEAVANRRMVWLA